MTAAADGKTTLTVVCKEGQSYRATFGSRGWRDTQTQFREGCGTGLHHGWMRRLQLSWLNPRPEGFQAFSVWLRARHRLRGDSAPHRSRQSREEPGPDASQHSRSSMEAGSDLRWDRWSIEPSWNGFEAVPPLTVPARRALPRSRCFLKSASSQGLEQHISSSQLRKYTDGTSRDVTHLVQYSSNNPDVVQVSADGKIKALQAGETAVMVRTLGQAVASKIYVPQPLPAKAASAQRTAASQLHRRTCLRQVGAPEPYAVGAVERRTLSASRLSRCHWPVANGDRSNRVPQFERSVQACKADRPPAGSSGVLRVLGHEVHRDVSRRHPRRGRESGTHHLQLPETIVPGQQALRPARDRAASQPGAAFVRAGAHQFLQHQPRLKRSGPRHQYQPDFPRRPHRVRQVPQPSVGKMDAGRLSTALPLSSLALARRRSIRTTRMDTTTPRKELSSIPRPRKR